MRLSLVILLFSLFAALVLTDNAATASPVTIDKAQLQRVEKYLAAIHSIRARFSQISPDGAIASGLFYLQRPGKLRMEYAPPVPVLVVTDDNHLLYYDSELDQVTHVSLDESLVGFLARDVIRFDDTVTVTGLERGKGSLRVSLVQAKRPKDGQMTLEFADAPLELRNIVMTDSADQRTVVTLQNAAFNAKLDPALFVFKDPHLGRRSHIKK